MKRAMVCTLAILFVLVIRAEAGNFNHFGELMEAGKFQQGDPIEGYTTWKKSAIVVGIHTSMNGDCDSGIIITGNKVKPDDAYMALEGIYYCLQWSLAIAGKGSIEPKNVPHRLHKLVHQIHTNLEHANTTEFVFDNLIVRGKRGKDITLLIYIPK